MRYMLLIYNDEKLAEQQREAMPEAEQERYMQAWFQYGDWLTEKGWRRPTGGRTHRRRGP